jgi:hypothetical protein
VVMKRGGMFLRNVGWIFNGLPHRMLKTGCSKKRYVSGDHQLPCLYIKTRSCLFFRTRRFGDWILSPSSGKTYSTLSTGPNWVGWLVLTLISLSLLS